MASSLSLLAVLSLSLLLQSGAVWQARGLNGCPFSTAIFAFGNSLSDTGNAPRSNNPIFLDVTAPPYGQTYFKQPACRFSNGRLIIDCLGEALGLGFQNPFLLFNSANFSNGVNYAVSGATALDSESLVLDFGTIPLTPLSLRVQLNWHLRIRQIIMSGGEDSARFPKIEALKKGLYFLEFGGNDIALTLNGGTSLQEVKLILLPMIVREISNAVQTLYENDARNIVLINTSPEGCVPFFLILNQNDTDRDQNGCLRRYNEANEEYTNLLFSEIHILRKRFHMARITFLNFYDAFKDIFNNQTSEFANNRFNPCCLPPQNNPLSLCNSNSSVCSDPNEYVNWDGIHFTDYFACQIVNSFIQGKNIDPPNAFSKCSPTILGRAPMEPPPVRINCSPGLF